MENLNDKKKFNVRIKRNFQTRESSEQEWLINNNYCDYCKKADTGIVSPIEYEINGKIFVEGFCKVCGNICISEIIE